MQKLNSLVAPDYSSKLACFLRAFINFGTAPSLRLRVGAHDSFNMAQQIAIALAAASAALASTPDVVPGKVIPGYKQTWNMSQSTAIMICNNSGTYRCIGGRLNMRMFHFCNNIAQLTRVMS